MGYAVLFFKFNSASYFNCEYTSFRPSEPAALCPSMSFPGKSFESLKPRGQLIFSLPDINLLIMGWVTSRRAAKSY